MRLLARLALSYLLPEYLMKHRTNIVLIYREHVIRHVQHIHRINGEEREVMDSYMGNLEEIFGEPVYALHVERDGLIDDIYLPKAWMVYAEIIISRSVRGDEVLKHVGEVPKEVVAGLHPLFDLPAYEGQLTYHNKEA